MANKKTLSFAEHLELGARVKEARKLLQDIQLRVNKGLGTSAKASRIANQVFDKFDSYLRHELDEAVHRDHPDQNPKELTGIYYGPTERSKVVLHHSRHVD